MGRIRNISLGQWLTHIGIKPLQKKVEGILCMQNPPKNSYTLKSPRHVASSFQHSRSTHKSNWQKTFTWNPSCDVAFKEMNAITTAQLLTIHGSSNQHNNNYTIIEKELSSMVEPCASSVTGFSVPNLTVTLHTVHKHLTYEMTAVTTQRVMCWRLLLEEHCASFHYKKA